ncbi:MAG: cysteine hydrolase, partial [Planctomycetota bacterium]
VINQSPLRLKHAIMYSMFQTKWALVDYLEKHHYDAFFNTSLEKFLEKNKIDTLVLGGVMTHLCCETTARSAFMRGYKVYFLINGTATYHRDFHRASLLNLSHGFAIPLLIEEALSWLETAKE